MADENSDYSSDHSKVHFTEDSESKTHEPEIRIQCSDDHADIHLGWLQMKHIYRVNFEIDSNLCEDIDSDPLENLHAKIISVKWKDGKHSIELDLEPHREKLIKEKLTLYERRAKSAKKFELILHARVLGVGKGTPSLKKGIKIIKSMRDEESDQSDWQGF